MHMNENSADKDAEHTEDYTSGQRIPRWVFFRFLGAIYFFAIASFWSQSMGLIGETGIYPARLTQEHFEAGLESGRFESWLDWPTWFYFMEGTDNSIHSLCFLGILLSIGLCVGLWTRVMLLAVWSIYLSLVTISSPFLPFQWDILLLEVSVVAFFYAPGTIIPGLQRTREPNGFALWLMRLLLFKLMLSSGVVKLISPDTLKNPNTWLDLTALNFHFWTQPIPHGLSLHAHHLGENMRELGVFFNHVIELIIPWLILFPVHRKLLVPWLCLTMGLVWTDLANLSLTTSLICGALALGGWLIPRWLSTHERISFDDGRWARMTAACGIVLFMLSIAGTGNYGFFNLLTIALALSCVDDRCLMAFIPRGLKETLNPPSATRAPSKFWWAICGIAACILVPWNLNRLILTVGGQYSVDARKAEQSQLKNGIAVEDLELDRSQRFWLWLADNDRDMNEKMGRFHIVRNYGLFATMTTERYELRIEGSQDGRVWKPIRFRYKPDTEDDLHFAWTHMPRLDWQMWFVSLWSSCQGRAFFQRNRWFFYFLDGIFEGSAEVNDLLEENPFAKTPPRFLRVLRDRARFSTPDEYAETGQPWVFTRVRQPFCPILDRNTLKRSGIHRTR